MRITTKILALFYLLVVPHLGADAQSLMTTNDIVDCGQVEFRHPVTFEFELTNISHCSTRISRVETYCDCYVANYTRNDIAVRGKTTVKVVYNASAMGHFCKLIDVYCEGEEAPLTLQIKGVVVREVVDYTGEFPYKIGSLMLDRDRLEFDDVGNGDQPQQVIHIRNVGSEVAQPNIMHLPDYLTADVSPSKLPPGRTGTITITLDSRLLDDYGLTQTRIYLGSRIGEKVSSDKEIGVSVILIPNVYDMTETERAVAPRVELSKRTIAFDMPKRSNKLKDEVLITNMGKSDLHISNLQMFTTGVSLSLNKQTIQPGEIAKLKVEVDANELQSLHGLSRILMITNDPLSPKVLINISFNGDNNAVSE